MVSISKELLNAREQWEWRGSQRPPFAIEPLPSQVSVWDFPRPPKLVPEKREIVVYWGDLLVAKTPNAWALLETAHPPTYYIPKEDVRQDLLQASQRGSFCEWKGQAQYWDLVNQTARLSAVGWSYPDPFEEAKCIAGHLAFYAHQLSCSVGGARVTPQAGGFYGGWITPDLAGPFKGEPGSGGW